MRVCHAQRHEGGCTAYTEEIQSLERESNDAAYKSAISKGEMPCLATWLPCAGD